MYALSDWPETCRLQRGDVLLQHAVFDRLINTDCSRDRMLQTADLKCEASRALDSGAQWGCGEVGMQPAPTDVQLHLEVFSR